MNAIVVRWSPCSGDWSCARWRYVYFGAADDAVLPGFFASALEMLAKNPEVGLFCGDAVLVDGETGRTIGYRPPVRPLQSGGVMSAASTAELLRRADNFILTGSAVFRRDLALEKGGFDPRAHSFADGLLARKIALAAGFCYLPRAMAVWNVFEAGLLRSTALDTPRALQALNELPVLIAADKHLPDWDGPLMARRWRFGSARSSGGATTATRVAARDGRVAAIDRGMLAIASPALGVAPVRWLVLAWLTMRLRPFRFRRRRGHRLQSLAQRAMTFGRVDL